MCTVSWLHEDDGYRLLCNRDEKRDRLPALEPHGETRRGVRFLAPIDGERGGTWLCVNEYGLGLCLLNGACLSGLVESSGTGRSRGEVPLALADARTTHQACARLADIELSAYAPFTLAIAQPGKPVAVAEWDGQRLTVMLDGDSFVPLISSSVDQAGVRAARQAEFARTSGLENFHRSHGDGPSAYSPCMHRADAETVSWSEIHVTANHVRLVYSDGPPCRGMIPVERSLERAS